MRLWRDLFKSGSQIQGQREVVKIFAIEPKNKNETPCLWSASEL
jgi:hypothetical protein